MAFNLGRPRRHGGDGRAGLCRDRRVASMEGMQVMTWIWWTIGIAVVGAILCVALAGAALLAVTIAGAIQEDVSDD